MNYFRRYVWIVIIILLIFSGATIIPIPAKYSAAQVGSGNASSVNTGKTTFNFVSIKNSATTFGTSELNNGTATVTAAFAKVTVNSLPVIKNETQFTHAIIPIKRYHSNLHLLSPRMQMASNTIINANSPQENSAQIKVAQTTISGFEGLNEIQSGGAFPPDIQMAAGPNHVAEMVNSKFTVFSKSGSVVSGPTSLVTFFNISSSDSVFDPKILYDSNSGRWFASVEDFTTNTIYLAVSSTNDPTGSWLIYQLTAFQGITYTPDQPILGISDDKVALSVNDFDNSDNFVQSQFDIFNKSELLAGAAVHSTLFTRTDVSIHPVQSLSSASTLYMVNTDFVSNVKLWSVTGVPTGTNPIIPTPTTISFSVGSISSPPTAIQPGTSTQFDTGDVRVLDAAWYQGNLWLSFSNSCTPTGDSQARACIHLAEINTNTSSLTQNFNFGTSGFYYFYPAIRIDGSGNLDLVFGYSSASVYPSIAISSQLTTDVQNTLEPSVAIKVGGGAVTETGSGSKVRYGDYFAAAVDPSNTSTVWVAGEYISSSVGSVGWSSFISSMIAAPIPSVPVGVTANVISASSITVSWTASSDATSYTIYRSTSQSGPFTTQVGTSTTTSFTDTGLSSGITYYYEIKATNSIGASALSSTASSTICIPPASGDWTVSSSCTLSNTATAPANVIVQSGSVLTIPNGLKLNIDFTHYHLLVKSGSGVLIKAGGTIK